MSNSDNFNQKFGVEDCSPADLLVVFPNSTSEDKGSGGADVSSVRLQSTELKLHIASTATATRIPRARDIMVTWTQNSDNDIFQNE